MIGGRHFDLNLKIESRNDDRFCFFLFFVCVPSASECSCINQYDSFSQPFIDCLNGNCATTTARYRADKKYTFADKTMWQNFIRLGINLIDIEPTGTCFAPLVIVLPADICDTAVTVAAIIFRQVK